VDRLGSEPLEVSRRAGHASTSFTQDRYGHLFPGADSERANRLEALVPVRHSDSTALGRLRRL